MRSDMAVGRHQNTLRLTYLGGQATWWTRAPGSSSHPFGGQSSDAEDGYATKMGCTSAFTPQKKELQLESDGSLGEQTWFVGTQAGRSNSLSQT